MSKYFETLRRLQSRSRPAARVEVPSATAGGLPEDLPLGPAFEAHLPLLPEIPVAGRQPAYSTLLDLLRAKTQGSRTGTVVIGGVSAAEPGLQVVRGISAQAQRREVRVMVAELGMARGARVLRMHPTESDVQTTQSGRVAVRRLPSLAGSSRSEDLRKLLERAAGEYELVIVRAPPLLDSVDGALLARNCEGLVLVVEVLRTELTSLRLAIEKAKMADCHLLGLVMVGTRARLPSWLRKLVFRSSTE